MASTNSNSPTLSGGALHQRPPGHVGGGTGTASSSSPSGPNHLHVNVAPTLPSGGAGGRRSSLTHSSQTYLRYLLSQGRRNPLLATAWICLILIFLFLFYVFLFETAVPWLPLYPSPRIVTFQHENQVLNEKEINREKKTAKWVTSYRYGPSHVGVAPPDTTYYIISDEWEETGPRVWNMEGLGPGGYTFVWRSQKLNYDTYGASKSSPAVDDHRIYIGTDRSTVAALDRRNGKVVWEYKCVPVHAKGIHGSPALDERNVYIGTYSGVLYAIDHTRNGTLTWSSKVGDFIGASPTIWNGGLYTGVEMRGPAGHLVGVDLKTGKEIFRSERLPNYCHSTPSIDPDTGLAFMGDNSGAVYCWNLTKDYGTKLVWKLDLYEGGDVKSTAAIVGDIVYITSWDNNLYALNKFTGSVLWRFQMGGMSMSSPSVDVSRKLVVVGSHDKCIYALDSRDGTMKWWIKTGGTIISSPTLLPHENVGLIGSGDGFVYVFALSSGRVLQKLQLESALTGVPVVIGRHLYVFDHLGYMYDWVVP
jgi:outer membrane protein assembly factor BamB